MSRFNSSELYMCAYQKIVTSSMSKWHKVEEYEIKNRFEIRMKNERAYCRILRFTDLSGI